MLVRTRAAGTHTVSLAITVTLTMRRRYALRCHASDAASQLARRLVVHRSRACCTSQSAPRAPADAADGRVAACVLAPLGALLVATYHPLSARSEPDEIGRIAPRSPLRSRHSSPPA